MSLVCVDELNLLKDIERLIKREIPRVVIEGYEPDLSIKAEPINKGRGKQQQPAANPAAGKAGASRKRRRSPFKEKPANQGQSRSRSRRSSNQGYQQARQG
jgi:ATP-dependent RNA helicase RhlE